MTMVTKPLPVFALCALALVAPQALHAQDLAAPASTAVAAAPTYEEPPTLSAQAILNPDFLQGARFKVQDEVPTYSGANQYTIESDYGVLTASGNELLMERIREIGALAKLDKIKESEEFKKALKKASASPLLFARNLAKQPTQTISGVPKGIWRMMNRAGDALKGVGQKIENLDEDQPKDPYSEGVLKNVAGFPQAKRDLAKRLGVDPYSTNEVLQREMNRLAWTSVGGASTLDLLMLPVGGGAGAALSATYFVSDLDNDLKDTDPAKLQKQNSARLLEMGLSEADAKRFMISPAFSPTRQTLFVAGLSRLGNPENISGFVKLALDADSEPDAVFFVRTVQVMATLVKNGVKIARMGVLGGIPICVTGDGSVLVALDWDYAAWTQMGERFITALQQPPAGQQTASPLRIVISGLASDRVRAELAQRKIALTELAIPGPLLAPLPK